MLKLIGVGLIGYGWNIKTNADDKYIDLRNTIKNEKIYDYQQDISKLDIEKNNIPDNIIVKIPHNLIDKKYSIGKIKLNRITTNKSTIIKYYQNGKLKIINNDEIKKEPFQSHLLFPTKIFKEFELDQIMFMNNKIKILFDNTITSKSCGHKNLIEKYFTIIQNSGIDYHKLHNPISAEYSIYSFPLSEYDFELEENFISHYNDIYLMVNPYKKSYFTELLDVESDIKLNIIAIADNKNKIIEEKYRSEISNNYNQYAISFLAIAYGITLLFVKS